VPITIGSNIGSLTAQRRLAEGTSALTKTYERLSSGQRINKASDDAAGLAIADDLRAKGRIYTKAISNGNDGISLLSIADSAADALTGVVTRIRELSEQAANGTYSQKQRAALDTEAQALAEEFKRIAQSTSFNGVRVFNGSLGGGFRLQMGIGLAQSLNTSIGGAIGTGSFGGQITYDTQVSALGDAYSRAVTLGDLNGDGILDMVTAGSYYDGDTMPGQLTIRLGMGDGTFGARHTFATEYGGSYDVTLGDLNADGILDLVTVGSAGQGLQGEASVFIGRGDGTFASKITFTTTDSSSRAVTLGDLNGDGILDMVTAGTAQVTGYTRGQVAVLFGRGDGTFRDRLTYSTDNSGGNTAAFAVALGDLNRDGILDIAAAGQQLGQGQVSLRLGRSDGTFGLQTVYTQELGTSSGTSQSVALGDLNGDGILDLLTGGTVSNGSGAQGQATVRLGTGNGTFGSRGTYSTITGVINGASNDTTLADVNGDGFLDMVASGWANNGTGSNVGQASVRLGQGNGTFGNRTTIATGTENTALALGDLSGDGVLDLVTAGSGPGVYGNQGQASVLLGTTQDGLGAMLQFSLKTKADALQGMGMLDRTLTNLAKQRGSIGASQTRVSVAISNLQTTRENFAAAEARIKDADMAQESAELTRTQILQQAAASVLTQANITPQLALRLLS